MDIKEMFSEEETRLFDYFKELIKRFMQEYCQCKTSSDLFNAIRKREIRKFSILDNKIFEWLKEFAPLHNEMIDGSPTCFIFNDSMNFSYSAMLQEDHCFDKYYLHVHATYKSLEDKGFNISFSKRTIEKFIRLGMLEKKKHIGGYLYTISIEEKLKLKNYIKAESFFAEMEHKGMVRVKSNDWILKKFSPKEIDITFSKHKDFLFNSLNNPL